MHQLLSLKAKLWIVVGLAVLVSASARWMGLDTVSLGAVVGIVEFLVIQLMLRSWRTLHRLSWLPRPAWARADLSGEWCGPIQSQWKKHPDDAAFPPIAATLDVHQSWQEVVFVLKTEKMRSRSIGAVPSFDLNTNEIRFRYFYETEPTAAASGDNPPQQLGSAVARVNLDHPDRMTITYANERGSRGDIELDRRRGVANHASKALPQGAGQQDARSRRRNPQKAQ